MQLNEVHEHDLPRFRAIIIDAKNLRQFLPEKESLAREKEFLAREKESLARENSALKEKLANYEKNK